MKIHAFYFNPYRQSTYVVTEWDEHAPANECIIVDAGMYSESEFQRFEQFLTKEHLTPTLLLITHPHPDHICGQDWLRQTYQLTPRTLDESVHEWGITRILTPGHHPDSVCYYFPSQHVIFTGDTLFYESIGRTDLPNGDLPTLMQSLKHLMTLPDNTEVYPGHGIATTIGHEKTHNPYL